MDHTDLHTESRAILDIRAASVVISREQIMQKPPPSSVGPSIIKDDWGYLLTTWINHFYTRDRVHFILRYSQLSPEHLQQALKDYVEIKQILKKTPNSPLFKNNAPQISKIIIDIEEIESARTIATDPKSTKGDWERLFGHWIFLNFSRVQIKDHLLIIMPEEDIPNVMKAYYDLFV
ncbi:hypothetical protein Plhal304r1_c036g0110751 [Plasmopara halstedii]